VTAAAPDLKPANVAPADPLAHLVLKADWPVALCGITVSNRLGTGAPAMDRCPDCLRISAERKLGRPGWA
jgi:hypothetical protein